MKKKRARTDRSEWEVEGAARRRAPPAAFGGGGEGRRGRAVEFGAEAPQTATSTDGERGHGADSGAVRCSLRQKRR